MRFIGVDPGLQGAIAVIAPNAVRVIPMPKRKGKIDWMMLHEKFGLLKPLHDMVFVERVSSFGIPGKGEATSFMNYGRLLMLLELSLLNYQEMAPQSWPTAYKDLFPQELPNPPKDAPQKVQQEFRNRNRLLRKARLVKIAMHLFPRDQEYSSGEADALLIAEAGRRSLARASYEAFPDGSRMAHGDGEEQRDAAGNRI